MLLKKIGSHRARTGAQAADGRHLALVGAIDHDWCHAGDIDQVALQHAQRDARRDPRVDGIPARLQHDKRGMRGAVMTGDRHVASSHEQRTQALDAG